jgi:RNA polymerase sigma factor (sigma-70 family)
MMTTTIMSAAVNNDAELVNGTLAGNRDAFGLIVSRYQSLICSLAYSATGSFGQSEDLAQETFITAWKHLGHLRERDKLRSWLCGIARNRINNFLRREGREPVRTAEPLENAAETHSAEALPGEQTISNEEQAILWRSLERIPEIYREPLVLFYREHQSIESVAADLDLTEDTVKQRLSRGRKMLQEQVLAFVEGALEKTNPGKVFTLGVLAALPALTISAKAATLSAAAAKGGATAKAAGAMGLFGAILSPLLVVWGNYASYRMSMDEAHSDEERGRIKTLFRRSLVVTVIISCALAVPLFWAFRNRNDAAIFWSLFFCQTIVIYFLTIFGFAIGTFPARRKYLAGLLANQYAGNFPPASYEYRSRLCLLGLPLVHVRFGDRFDVLRGPVKAWFAFSSSHAVGLIFAFGGIAIAPVSFGGIAVGLLPFGAIGVGLVSLGAISLGVWAFGGLAIGWQVFAGVGIAWNMAMGGIAFAHDFALGGIAHAAQANNEMTRQSLPQNLFFRCSYWVSNHAVWLIFFSMIPVTLQARIAARARRRREQGDS